MALHLVSPVIGFVVIAFVLASADVHAKIGGLSGWRSASMMAIGLRVAGRSTELKLEG